MTGAGKMILAIYLNERGTIDRVDIESSDISDDMKALLLKQFSGVRLRPGQKDGTPVPSTIRIEITVLPQPPPPPRLGNGSERPLR